LFAPFEEESMAEMPTNLERRAAQRFEYQVRVAVLTKDRSQVDLGFTQDLSAKGAFLFTQLPLEPGDNVELILTLPTQITMAEESRVRCRAKVQRCTASTGAGRGVGVVLAAYEFLPEGFDENLPRVAGLHENRYSQDERPAPAHVPLR
jgi:hypothetical protein